MSSGPVNLPPPSGSSSGSSSVQGAQGSYLDALAQAKKAAQTSDTKSTVGPAQEALGKMQVGAPQGGVVTLPPPTKGLAAAVKGMQQPLTMEPDVKQTIVSFRSDLRSGALLRLPEYPTAQKVQSEGMERRTMGGNEFFAEGGGGDGGGTNLPIAQSDQFLGTNIAEAAMDFIDIMLQKMATMNAMTSSFAQFASEFQQFSYEKADSSFNSMLAQGIGQAVAGAASLGAFVGAGYNMSKTGVAYNEAAAKRDQYSQEMEEKFGSEALSSKPVTMSVQNLEDLGPAAQGELQPPQGPPEPARAAGGEGQEGEIQVDAQAKPAQKTYSKEEKERLERGIKKSEGEMSRADSKGRDRGMMFETASHVVQNLGQGATSIAKGAYDRKQQQDEALSSMSQEGLSRTLQFYNTVAQQATDASTQSAQFVRNFQEGETAVLRG